MFVVNSLIKGEMYSIFLSDTLNFKNPSLFLKRHNILFCILITYLACKATTFAQYNFPVQIQKTVLYFPNPKTQHLAKYTKKVTDSVNPTIALPKLLPFLDIVCNKFAIVVYNFSVQVLLEQHFECRTTNNFATTLRPQLFQLILLNQHDLELLVLTHANVLEE